MDEKRVELRKAVEAMLFRLPDTGTERELREDLIVALSDYYTYVEDVTSCIRLVLRALLDVDEELKKEAETT
jgi:hypothetical protein